MKGKRRGKQALKEEENLEFMSLEVAHKAPNLNRPRVTRLPMYGKHFYVNAYAKRLFGRLGKKNTSNAIGYTKGMFMVYYRLTHLFCQALWRAAEAIPVIHNRDRGVVQVQGVELVDYSKLRPEVQFPITDDEFELFIDVLNDECPGQLRQAMSMSDERQSQLLHRIRSDAKICDRLLYNVGPGFVSFGKIGVHHHFYTTDDVAAQAYFRSLEGNEREQRLFCDYLVLHTSAENKWSLTDQSYHEWVGNQLSGANGEMTGKDDVKASWDLGPLRPICFPVTIPSSHLEENNPKVHVWNL